MTEGIVETIVARCLVDQDFTDALVADRASALKQYRLEPEVRREFESFDLETIRRFSGFIGKIQHNFLWEFFSATRLLLQYYNIESDVFVAYRRQQMSLPKTTSRKEKIRYFLDFLEKYLRDSAKFYPCLTAVIRHERVIWKLSNILSQTIAETDVSRNEKDWKTFQSLIIRINGELLIQACDFDPLPVISQVKEGTFRGVKPGKKSRFLGYWKASGGREIRLLNLDRFFVHVLSKINKKRNVRQVIAHVRRGGLQGIAPSAFREFFEQARDAGLIYLCKR